MPPSGIRVIFEKASKIPDMVRFEVGEPDFDTPRYISEEAKRAIDSGFTHYTSSSGIPALREAIATKLKAENSMEVEPKSEVLVTPGAGSAVYLSIMCTINPGDEVLVPDPAWPHYDACVRMAGGKVVRYGVGEETGFRPDMDEVSKLVNSRTKALVLNSPSNPTGGLLTRKDVEAFAGLAVGEDLLVISDEIYQKIIYDQEEHCSIASLNGMKERTVTIGGFSKTYAMTGWRIGYAVAPSEITVQMDKLNLYTAACANSISQKAALAALGGSREPIDRMLDEYRKRRTLIVSRLNEIEGFSCAMPRGAFYVFPRIDFGGLSAFDAAMYLVDNARVSTVPGTAFGSLGEDHLRLSYATSTDRINEGMDRIQQAVKKMKPMSNRDELRKTVAQHN